MTRWEYQVVPVCEDYSVDFIQNMMDNEGVRGWELVCTQASAHPFDLYNLFFKKPIEDDSSAPPT